MANALNSQERKILTDHIRYRRRSAYRHDWPVYRSLAGRGLLTLTLTGFKPSSVFNVSTSPAGREALMLVGVAA